MKKFSLISALFFLSTFCFSQTRPKCWFPATGYAWRGALQLNDTTKLEFLFQIDVTKENKTTIYIYNGEERITVSEVINKNDSLKFKMPVFDSEFKLKWIAHKVLGRDSLCGVWINHARKEKNTIPFHAERIQYKAVSTCFCKPFTGKWEATFSPGDKENESKAIGIFSDPNCWDLMSGTFLTETGDYRYLSGSSQIIKNDTVMQLQCFDGAHAFFFTAKKKADGTIEGDYYSGIHWHEKWIAKRNDKFELRNPDSLTYLKPGYDKIDFKFKDLDGKVVSLSDERYKNKVVIVQLMGSWCPNCMDETKFFSGFYTKYKDKGLEIVALAFEKMTDPEKAKANLLRLQKKFNVHYAILITEKVGKGDASSELPMLNEVMAFPTTIYIDKKGRVRKIYTGFSGPGTGIYYDNWVETTTIFVEKLLKE